MKKITLSLLLLLMANIGFGQITYFHYLDYSSEWRHYGAGWDGMGSYESYRTTYFDGDATLNGYTYYQQYQKVANTYTNWQGTYTEEFFGGPHYVREDESGKIYILNADTMQETVMFDSQPIVAAQIGDPFPYDGATCNVESTQTLYLGTQPLKLVRGSVDWETTGSLEGVGVIGLACAVGVEGNGYTACYTKNGHTIHFGTADCDDFPIPLRVHMATQSFLNDAIAVSPNPAKDWIDIQLKSGDSNHQFRINDLRGATVLQGGFEGTQSRIDVSMLASGLYLLQLDSGASKKIIKQ